MKIDKVTGGHITQTKFHQAAKQTEDTNEVKTINEPIMQANLAAISSAQEEMNTLSDVDMEKVEQVKNSLKRGELELDTQALSRAVMQFHTGHE
ncbi:flagellar biosynthesis anti-sigma factor FlgM [Vibrio sagamiensis]|uniref:Negative regulator of flagellin synthesis n=1 Tax=Vibrio sagamiensis NBRC 104589 TaxID=1219064 RepID=A0A511QD47_9VIBR|nr:flagellar biosynthesis anti-sigma factor FlgM [Vibrio sagamiensis]PNQ66937.1 flagellar biosynthesis anti-sigma factor FlgM [Vibrio agarivorans]GEM75230.1 flagellar biosynthesis anti-sigma factor FlgM [Vibrio sagamiensis NBRC 104589]